MTMHPPTPVCACVCVSGKGKLPAEYQCVSLCLSVSFSGTYHCVSMWKLVLPGVFCTDAQECWLKGSMIRMDASWGLELSVTSVPNRQVAWRCQYKSLSPLSGTSHSPAVTFRRSLHTISHLSLVPGSAFCWLCVLFAPYMSRLSVSVVLFVFILPVLIPFFGTWHHPSKVWKTRGLQSDIAGNA